MSTATELAIAIFGLAPGGYSGTLNNYETANGEVGLADWLAQTLKQINPNQATSNAGFASLVTQNLIGNSVSTANQQFVTNFITLGKRFK